MIKFLRQVRKQLVVENRVSKYLIYAFGEIVLVVIGILLALQFNNANQKDTNTKKERGYLISIVEDIEYQKVMLKALKEHCSESIEVGKSIIKEFQKQTVL